MMHSKKQATRSGFTLVEVLIVVVILGILAATVLPQFTSANDDALEAALMQDLQVIRSQIELYKYQHLGKYPANGSTNQQDFIDAMLLSSDANGTTGAVGTKPFGPYFVGQVPPNPFSGARGIKIVSDVPGTAPDDSATLGWIYNPANGQIKANSSGQTSKGVDLDTL